MITLVCITPLYFHNVLSSYQSIYHSANPYLFKTPGVKSIKSMFKMFILIFQSTNFINYFHLDRHLTYSILYRPQ